MKKRLLTISLSAILISFVVVSVTCAQTKAPNVRRYLHNKPMRGIDDGMLKRAPLTGDEKMARRAPEHIDDGIFTPRRVFKSYLGTVRPSVEKK